MRHSPIHFFLLLFLALPHTLVFADPAAKPVEAWEGTIDLPTYDWEDDPYPRFWALQDKIIYPYPMQDVISTTKENRKYKALFLENEYLKVVCLPELGGRLFSVLNKVTGEEMFHRNDVVKPGLIGMRGAWISGGVEWNTGPHGHTVTAISPVNALVRKNPDGSATLFVSNTEQIFRTRWRVDVTLYPDRSYLHEEVSIFNPRDEIHPYYFWNCTAFPCGKGTRFIFPMTLGCDHDGREFFKWPMHEGKDISWLKNYDRPTSVFAWECDQDFFGCYDVDLDKGLVQVADHRVLKGKKAWTWGQSDDGRVSQNALTDEDGPYIEVQSGPLLTQADYGELFPRQEVAWEEWWYPVFGFNEGFDYANREVVVEVAAGKESGLIEHLNLLSTVERPDSKVILRDASGDQQTFTVQLSPRGAAAVKIESPSMKAAKVTLLDSDGVMLAEFDYPANLAVHEPPVLPQEKAEEEMTAEELFAKALEKDRETSRGTARELYEKALEKDPGHVEAAFRLGVSELESGLFEKATERFKSVQQADPDHPWAAYFLGSALFQVGQFSEVLPLADRTIELHPDSSVGYDLKGRALMRLGRREQVIPLFETAVENNHRDQRAADHLVMALFGAGRNEEAFSLARERMFEDPTNLIPRVILNFNDPQQPRNFFQETYRFLGEHAFEYIEVQEVFRSLGMPKVAFLFANPLMVDPFGGALEYSPLQHFHSALIVLEMQQVQAAAGLIRRLGEWDAEGVFPSRLESIAALNSVWTLLKDDGRIALLMGNILADKGRLKEASDQWTEAVRLSPTLAQGHRNLGLYHWKETKDLERAEAFYRRAIALEPKDQTLHAELAEILADRPADVVALISSIGLDRIKRNDLRESLAKAFNDLGEYTKTVDFLNSQVFSNWESRQTSRNLWVQALIARGKTSLEADRAEAALADFETALTYPEHLGVGRPAEPTEAEAQYWRGKALQKLERLDEAKEAWMLGAEGVEGSGAQSEFREKCTAELKAL